VVLSGVSWGLTQAWAEGLPPRAQPRGLYTEAQATRGLAVYERACAGCHRLDLLGDATEEVPPLVDEEFVARWGSAPLKELSDFVRQNMPGNAARSLSSGDYSDVLAYLLKANRMPAGTQELTAMTPLDNVSLPRPKEQP
jgi:cytochrome c